MKMARDEMVYAVMRKWGFESMTALTFAKIAETWTSDYAVENMFIVAMAIGYEPNEEE